MVPRRGHVKESTLIFLVKPFFIAGACFLPRIRFHLRPDVLAAFSPAAFFLPFNTDPLSPSCLFKQLWKYSVHCKKLYQNMWLKTIPELCFHIYSDFLKLIIALQHVISSKMCHDIFASAKFGAKFGGWTIEEMARKASVSPFPPRLSPLSCYQVLHKMKMWNVWHFLLFLVYCSKMDYGETGLTWTSVFSNWDLAILNGCSTSSIPLPLLFLCYFKVFLFRYLIC